MVRANYNNLKKGIHETTEYLELFLRNLLLDEKNELHNRSIVEQVTGLKSSRASEIINLMLENEIIESVKGHGKGKYKFK